MMLRLRRYRGSQLISDVYAMGGKYFSGAHFAAFPPDQPLNFWGGFYAAGQRKRWKTARVIAGGIPFK
jgi:hypothetical protein